MPRKPVNWHADAKVSLSRYGWRITKHDGKTALTAARYLRKRSAVMALQSLRYWEARAAIAKLREKYAAA